MTDRVCETSLAATFEESRTPQTGRRVIQLTDGPGFSYPLYYYIPSLRTDGRYLIHHRAHDGEVQLHRLDLATGDSVQLTDASAADAHWRYWCTDPGAGVLDHRSVLNVERDTVIYFDGIEARSVSVETLADEQLFSLPEGRWPIGQNCVTPDGEWFVYIHHDSELFDEMHAGDGVDRHRSTGTVLAAYHFDSGDHRELLRINSPIHHVLPYDDERVVFCHPATENGMLLTDLEGGWYTHLRTRDEDGGEVCHYLATEAGITYEVLGGSNGILGGVYDPETHDRVEFDLPEHFGYTHTGYDPAGELLYYETNSTEGHGIWYLDRYDPGGAHDWDPLVADWETFGGGQKSHFHPRLTQDRDWLLFTAGDQDSETNQLYLLDIADVENSRGLPAVGE